MDTLPNIIEVSMWVNHAVGQNRIATLYTSQSIRMHLRITVTEKDSIWHQYLLKFCLTNTVYGMLFPLENLRSVRCRLCNSWVIMKNQCVIYFWSRLTSFRDYTVKLSFFVTPDLSYYVILPIFFRRLSFW